MAADQNDIIGVANTCSDCGVALVVIQDEYSDGEFCPNCECGEPDYEDDGQPSEYDEWQDYYGGDDWDHGQYDHYDEY